ncbi:MAG: helix-turn-helix domain-containing protein, partial [Clostridia bacterium]|nr:helix-turn-helix domain-containing protein [Clostridia bacterium]
MLSENLKNLRKAKGLSQEELAIKLNVVRQTVSKWEKGLSVPDSEMLIRLAEALDTSVTVLLGETIDMQENEPTDLKVLSEKLELLNEQFARQNEKRRKIWRAVFVAIGIIASIVLLGELIEFI